MNKNLIASAAALLLTACAADSDTVANEPAFLFGAGPDLSAEKVEIIEVSVERLNKALGFDAVGFEPGDYFTRGQFVDEPAKQGYIAWAKSMNQHYNCAVLIGKLGLKEEEFELDVYTTMHEMLHCLGVQHDDDRDSIMYKDRLRNSKKQISDTIRDRVMQYLEESKWTSTVMKTFVWPSASWATHASPTRPLSGSPSSETRSSASTQRTLPSCMSNFSASASVRQPTCKRSKT